MQPTRLAKDVKLCVLVLLVRWKFFLFKLHMATEFLGFRVDRAGIILVERHFLGDVLRVFLNVIRVARCIALGIFASADETDFDDCAFFSHFSYLNFGSEFSLGP